MTPKTIATATTQNKKAWFKSLTFASMVFSVIAISLALATFYVRDLDNSRIRFTLTDQHHRTVTQRDLAGQYLLVFFGFTHCRDICPTQMSKLSQALSELQHSGHGQRLQPVFISLDPERDNPAQLRDFLTYFHRGFIGLTGTRAQLEAAAASFKTYLQAAPKEPEADYQLTHSAVIYLVDPFGRIIEPIPFEADYRAIAQRVRQHR